MRSISAPVEGKQLGQATVQNLSSSAAGAEIARQFNLFAAPSTLFYARSSTPAPDFGAKRRKTTLHFWSLA